MCIILTLYYVEHMSTYQTSSMCVCGHARTRCMGTLPIPHQRLVWVGQQASSLAKKTCLAHERRVWIMEQQDLESLCGKKQLSPKGLQSVWDGYHMPCSTVFWLAQRRIHSSSQRVRLPSIPFSRFPCLTQNIIGWRADKWQSGGPSSRTTTLSS
jgi:hypothetical protein